VAVIYLQHPQYGTKVAISDSEADYDERNGWARYNPDELEVAVVNELEVKRKYTRRAIAEGV
jgi:hypothetical protein